MSPQFWNAPPLHRLKPVLRLLNAGCGVRRGISNTGVAQAFSLCMYSAHHLGTGAFQKYGDERLIDCADSAPRSNSPRTRGEGRARSLPGAMSP